MLVPCFSSDPDVVLVSGMTCFSSDPDVTSLASAAQVVRSCSPSPSHSSQQRFFFSCLIFSSSNGEWQVYTQPYSDITAGVCWHTAYGGMREFTHLHSRLLTSRRLVTTRICISQLKHLAGQGMADGSATEHVRCLGYHFQRHHPPSSK